MSSFTERDLNIIAKDFSERYYGIDLTIPVEINGRKNGRGLGSFRYIESIRKSLKIEMSKRYVEQYKDETIIDTILHELCHYYCFETNQPFKDGEYYFESQLRRVGASSTGIKAHAGDMFKIICSNCGRPSGEVKSVRSLGKYLRGYTRGKKYIRYYKTQCCNAPFIQGEKYQIEDNYVANEKIQEAYKIALKLLEDKKPQQRVVVGVPKSEKNIRAVMTQTQTVTVEHTIIVPGKRGVTNAQMIPAIEQAVKDNNKEHLIELQKQYPVVFESSRKYIKKSLSFRFLQLMES